MNERRDNYYFGRIWVDENDYSILRIECKPAAIEDFIDPKSVAIMVTRGSAQHRLICTIDYGVEKEGVHFPSMQTIKDSYAIVHKGKEESDFLNYKIIIRYTKYKFFIVNTSVTEEKIK